MDKFLLKNEFFYCEPLLEKRDNLKLLKSFRVKEETGYGLEIYLKRQAVSDEMSHEARTYLVKDIITDEIVGYFSLKSGMVATRRRWNLFHTVIDSLPAVELANFAGNSDERSVDRRLMCGPG